MQMIPFLATYCLAETRVMALSFVQNTRYWMNYKVHRQCNNKVLLFYLTLKKVWPRIA